MQKAAFEFQSAVCSKWPFFAGHWNAVRLRIREKGVACRSPFLGSHLAASVDGAWVEHKVQHQNYDWKLLTSIGKVMKL